MQAASPNLVSELIDIPSMEKLRATPSTHKPRILLLYGSLRERSYSKLLTLEAERLLHLLTRDISPYLTDRYSERKESTEKLHQRLSLAAAT